MEEEKDSLFHKTVDKVDKTIDNAVGASIDRTEQWMADHEDSKVMRVAAAGLEKYDQLEDKVEEKLAPVTEKIEAVTDKVLDQTLGKALNSKAADRLFSWIFDKLGK